MCGSSRIDSGYHNADSGGASRFYHQSDWSYEILEQIESADPVRYCAKAGQSERNAGLDEFEQQEVAYSKYRENYKDTKDFVTHYPDGTPRPVNPTKNSHPTCKPISLIKYLSSLLLPPDHYGDNRRILVPFSGVSSEMIGAMLAGWPHITGIELTEEYIPIAQQRMKFWSGWAEKGITDPKEILKMDKELKAIEEKNEGQMRIFE